MRSLTYTGLLLCLNYARAHGDHGKQEGETIQQYAQRHMSQEHHIDTFDLRSFFHLHDLNRDGFWDKEEVEAVYGVHHIYNKKKSKDDEEHKIKADYIVTNVLAIIDKDRDGKISLAELDHVGLDALPNFDNAEGHHYDVESEYFLHHEEMYHNTPETQTDESYNHPEDIEHFAHHEEIERKEAEKEAVYEGITVEEALAQHEHDGEPMAKPDHSEQVPLNDGPGIIEHAHVDERLAPKYTRVPKPDKADPVEKFRDAKQQGSAHGDWGEGNSGYKTPKTPGEKLRKNTPYKERMQYKFKRNWGDF